MVEHLAIPEIHQDSRCCAAIAAVWQHTAMMGNGELDVAEVKQLTASYMHGQNIVNVVIHQPGGNLEIRHYLGFPPAGQILQVAYMIPHVHGSPECNRDQPYPPYRYQGTQDYPGATRDQ